MIPLLKSAEFRAAGKCPDAKSGETGKRQRSGAVCNHFRSLALAALGESPQPDCLLANLLPVAGETETPVFTSGRGAVATVSSQASAPDSERKHRVATLVSLSSNSVD